MSAIKHERFASGDYIFHQGDRTVYFYVIVTGHVQFVKESEHERVRTGGDSNLALAALIVSSCPPSV